MPMPPPLLVGHTRELTIGHLFEGGTKGALPGTRMLLNLPLPEWQREEVWSEGQKRAFLEGVFLGFGTGFYVINGLDWDDNADLLPHAGCLLDGQQRISALRDFVRNGLVIFDDVTFDQLSLGDQRRFFNKKFQCFELNYSGDERVLRELYDRLNFSGVAHTEDQRAIPVPPVRVYREQSR